MPNFTARITAGASTLTWADPAVADQDPDNDGVPAAPVPRPYWWRGAPSRTNPTIPYPHRYYFVPIGTLVTVKATVAGVEGPLDAALGGDLFFYAWPEFVAPPPPITLAAGQSSVATFTPIAVGHYLLRIRRPNGGAILIPFDVDMI